MLKTATKATVKNMVAIRELLDGIIAKMIAGTEAPIEAEIARDIASGYFEEGGSSYRQAIDECEEAHGTCPVTGLEEWPEDRNDQIMLLKGISESIENFVAAPPKTPKEMVTTQVTMVIKQRYNNKNDLPISRIPKSDPNFEAVVLTAYDD